MTRKGRNGINPEAVIQNLISSLDKCAFGSCLLSQRWKRYDKDYEEFLLALLSNGYTKAKIQEICKSLGISYSEVAMRCILLPSLSSQSSFASLRTSFVPLFSMISSKAGQPFREDLLTT